MRTIKLLGVAAVLALALAAFVGASSAQAKIRILSCEYQKNCQPASTPEAAGGATKFKMEGTINLSDNTGGPKCPFELDGEVADNESASGSDQLALSISAVRWGLGEKCGGYEFKSENLPWSFTTNTEKWALSNRLATNNLRWWQTYPLVGQCAFGNTAKRSATMAWGNGVFTSLSPTDSVEYLPGYSPVCHYWNLGGLLHFTSVNDPANPAANNLVIE